MAGKRIRAGRKKPACFSKLQAGFWEKAGELFGESRRGKLLFV
jgi:hypothetical protein